MPCRLGSSLTVTCLPAAGDPSEAQFVASVSSISFARLIPSPLAVAPFALEARLRSIWTRRSRVWPAPNEAVSRAAPKPSPRATNSYEPGTIRNVGPSGVAGSVSAIGVTRAS